MPSFVHNNRLPTFHEPLQYNNDGPGGRPIVLGSDDEEDVEEQKRRRERRERVGRAYVLEGRVPFIQSARLKGPFENGWKNPWLRKRLIPSMKQGNGHSEISEQDESTQNPEDGFNADSCHDTILPRTKNRSSTHPNKRHNGPHLEPEASRNTSRDDLDRTRWQAEMLKADSTRNLIVKSATKRPADTAWLKSVDLKRARNGLPRQSSPSAQADERRSRRIGSRGSSDKSPKEMIGSKGSTVQPEASISNDGPQVLEDLNIATLSAAFTRYSPASDQLIRDDSFRAVRKQKATIAGSHAFKSAADPFMGSSFSDGLTSFEHVSKSRSRDHSLEAHKQAPIHQSAKSNKSYTSSTSETNEVSTEYTPNQVPPGKIIYHQSPAAYIVDGLSQASRLARAALDGFHPLRQTSQESETQPYDLSDLLAEDAASSRVAALLSQHAASEDITTIEIKSSRPTSGAPSSRPAARSGIPNEDKPYLKHEQCNDIPGKAMKASVQERIRRSVDLNDVDSPGFAHVARERDMKRRAFAGQRTKNIEKQSQSLEEPVYVESEQQDRALSPVGNCIPEAVSIDTFEFKSANPHKEELHHQSPVELDGLEIRDPNKEPFELGGIEVGNDFVAGAQNLLFDDEAGEKSKREPADLRKLVAANKSSSEVDGPPQAEDDPSEVESSSPATTSSIAFEEQTTCLEDAHSQKVNAQEKMAQSMESTRASSPMQEFVVPEDEAHEFDFVNIEKELNQSWQSLEVGSPTLSRLPDMSQQNLVGDGTYIPVQTEGLDCVETILLEQVGSPTLSQSPNEDESFEKDVENIEKEEITNIGCVQPVPQSPWTKVDAPIGRSLTTVIDNPENITSSQSSSQDIFFDSQLPQNDDNNEILPSSQQSTESHLSERCSTPENAVISSSIHNKPYLRPETPEPEETIMSFRDLMTPSPERSCNVLMTDISNTQQLVDAATANPWATSTAKPKLRRSLKRVSFGPLPDSTDNDDKEPIKADRMIRMASPPPPPEAHRIMMEEDRFTGLLRSTSATPEFKPALKRIHTPSQRSPGVSAMAAAFMAADEGGIALSEKRNEASPLRESKWSNNNNNSNNKKAGNNHNHSHGQQYGDTSSSFLMTMNLDDAELGNVVQEMGSFLEGWDVDEEMKKARRGRGMVST